MRVARNLIVAGLLVGSTFAPSASLGQAAPAAPAAPTTAPAAAGSFMLTVILRHDQGMTLDEINAHQDRTGFLRMFPPEGVDVVSWHVVMGIGQVVTLRVPPDKLRAVNLAVERGAWGAFRSEFHPTYDLWPHIQARKQQSPTTQPQR